MRLRKRVREFAHSLGLGHDNVAEKHVLNGGAGVPPGSLTQGKLLAVNIAKNKTTPQDDVEAVTNDYVYCVDRLAPYADILVVNVSSPNTPGLRTLQQSDILKKILTGVVQAANSVDRSTKPAVMVKVSPDEDSDEQIAGICDAIWGSGVDGVIVGNTTNRRPGPLPYLKNLSPLEEQILLEHGGFSGPHLFERTKDLVRRYKKLLTDKPEDVELPQ
ncbi:MAG: Dihydroorotate dehydrogenase (quinone), mitochondrial, partial [Watsoniomyces obsoletus]